MVYKTAADLQMALLTILSKSLTLLQHSMVAGYQVYHDKANFKKNKTKHLDIDCLKHSEEFTSLSAIWINFLIMYFKIVLNIRKSKRVSPIIHMQRFITVKRGKKRGRNLIPVINLE